MHTATRSNFRSGLTRPRFNRQGIKSFNEGPFNEGPFNEGPFCERVSYIRQDYHSEDEIVDILKNTKVNLHNKA